MISLRVGLGRAVARLRRAAGYSQEAFAHACKVHRTYMTGIERGRHNVSLDLVERVAKGLKLDTGQLMAEAERERREGAPAAPGSGTKAAEAKGSRVPKGAR